MNLWILDCLSEQSSSRISVGPTYLMDFFSFLFVALPLFDFSILKRTNADLFSSVLPPSVITAELLKENVRPAYLPTDKTKFEVLRHTYICSMLTVGVLETTEGTEANKRSATSAQKKRRTHPFSRHISTSY